MSKEDRKELPDRQQLLDNILNASPVAIAYYEGRRIKWLNDAMMAIFGLQEYLGMEAESLYAYPEEYGRVRSIFLENLKDGKPTSIEAQFRRADGSIFPGLLFLSAMDPTRPSQGNMAVLADLTEKKRLERQQRETEERYRNLVEESFDGILIHDGATITFVNSVLCQMLGYERDELIGKEYWRIFHPDYHQTVQDRSRERLKGENPPPRYEARLRRNNGISLDVELNAKVFRLRPHLSVQVWIKDISKSKIAEQELNEGRKLLDTILKASPVGIARVQHRRTVWVNPALLDMFGFENESECVGRSTAILYSSEDEFNRIGQFVYSPDKTGLLNLEGILRRKDGTLFEGHIDVRILDPSNPIRDAIVVYADISERKKAERELHESRRMMNHVLSASPVGIVRLHNRTIRWANRGLLEMFGFQDESECVGQSVALLYASQDEFDRVGEIVYSGLEHDGLGELDVALRRKDGAIFEGHVNVRAVDPANPRMDVTVVYTDISERKKAERELRENQRMLNNILSTSPVGILRVQDRNIIWGSKAFVEMIGFGDETEFLGKNSEMLYASRQEYERVGKIIYDKSVKGLVSDVDAVFRRKDGTLFRRVHKSRGSRFVQPHERRHSRPCRYIRPQTSRKSPGGVAGNGETAPGPS